MKDKSIAILAVLADGGGGWVNDRPWAFLGILKCSFWELGNKETFECGERVTQPLQSLHGVYLEVCSLDVASEMITNLSTVFRRGGQQIFFKSPQIANLQILGLSPLSQICKFHMLWVRKLQIRKFLQNTAQLRLKTVLKVFWNIFLFCTNLNQNIIYYTFFVSRKVCIWGLVEVLSL